MLMVEPNFKIKELESTKEFGEFAIEPLEPGYGHTLGHALRRALLISIPGVAITSVKISGAKHRFSTLPGLKENIVDLLLNLKGLSFKLADGKTTSTVRLSVKGAKEITGKDVDLPDGVEIVNKDHYIASLSDKKGKLEMEMTIDKGYGYSLSEERRSSSLGVIPTDAIFSPVKRVRHHVSATRVGRQTNLDKLVISVWTNGVITPREAIDEAARTVSSYFTQIYDPKAEAPVESSAVSSSVPDAVLKLTVDELDLPTRIYNSLRNGGIETLGDLLTTPRKDLISMRNMGGKSISVIEDKLKEKGIELSA
ncbi:MAG: DNA-directed RNA polymerase subunit alpha [Candidatus Levybacteria bacterium RIFOXYA1_FULL_41_10]|nr:MAG: DNA-directed RNA polymerase subunit alpha [Candidatus Levybacteria bacterium GW2011_GWC1_40_19]KKR95326.1 MAG: DNA-directed RNA polymerase subunit alpha [Candidatus Levybacteria bacterium GW2011_GWA2_41_15]OGH20242.1 MAG: DNA-directed RNA polymerase subunit alpha [Candidatus Levybacteria bacterium RIFCSPHIGHO2_01_FULL_40_83]OGH25237.1 MAG: DNA-directed RNA polymerase subunit alpha [Candidatus Levybacteria bacterium RIFCSPHIGHO2_02_FULL_40_29]OGH32852.1 MAG: DNA-directed RNA polymerase s